MTTKTTATRKPRSTRKPAAKKPAAPRAPKTDSLPINPFLHEVFQLCAAQKTKAKKVEVLQNYEHISLKVVFIWNFDESVVSLLPEGEVPYGNVEEQTSFSGNLSANLAAEARGGESALGQKLDSTGRTSLRKEHGILYNFVKGGNGSLSTIRREMMFINLLEGLHPLEAESCILAKDKALEDRYNIPFDVVQEAYPDIQWGNRS